MMAANSAAPRCVSRLRGRGRVHTSNFMVGYYAPESKTARTAEKDDFILRVQRKNKTGAIERAPLGWLAWWVVGDAEVEVVGVQDWTGGGQGEGD